MKKEFRNWCKRSYDDIRKLYRGEVVDLKESYRLSTSEASDGVPTVFYSILLHETGVKIGSIDLRLKMDSHMYYYGHIGYSILPKHRGHHYAYYACKELFKIARDEFGMDEIIVTCSPENIASFKTLKRLGGTLVEVVDVPREHELYLKNERVKCIFRYDLKEL